MLATVSDVSLLPYGQIAVHVGFSIRPHNFDEDAYQNYGLLLSKDQYRVIDIKFRTQTTDSAVFAAWITNTILCTR